MRNLLKAISVLSLAILFSFSLSKNKKVVIIDAGHGGEDLGATRDGISEKELVLNIAKKIEALNQNENLKIILTRSDDSFSTLEDRTSKINTAKADYAISLHLNNSPSETTEKNGMEVFVQNNEISQKLASRYAEKFPNTKIINRNLHILRESNVPAILLELGFMNNPVERNYLRTEKGQNETAGKILSFINEN